MFGETGARRCRDGLPVPCPPSRAAGPSPTWTAPPGTQVPSAVIEAIAGYYRSSNANTHGQFVTSHETDALIASARETVAAFLGAPSRHGPSRSART